MAEDNQTCAIFQRSQARILLKNVGLIHSRSKIIRPNCRKFYRCSNEENKLFTFSEIYFVDGRFSTKRNVQGFGCSL